jgi:hypothetical protein
MADDVIPDTNEGLRTAERHTSRSESKRRFNMRKLLALLLLLAAPATAAEFATTSGAERYVADDLEVPTLSNGQVAPQLVSRNRITPRQMWVDSVYRSQGSILVFQGTGELTQPSAAAGSDAVRQDAHDRSRLGQK